MMIPRLTFATFLDSPSLLRVPAHGAHAKILEPETASKRVDLCTFSTTKRLRHSGNTKPTRCRLERNLIEVRCSSTRLAHFDQLERFSQSPRREPGDCSSRRREGTAQARGRHSGRAPTVFARGTRGVRPPDEVQVWRRGAGQLERGSAAPGRQPADAEPSRTRGQASPCRGHARWTPALCNLRAL
jgi:hypothetical protein